MRQTWNYLTCLCTGTYLNTNIKKQTWSKGPASPPQTHTRSHTQKQRVGVNTRGRLSVLSCQASPCKRGSGDTVGWLEVFRAVPLFWWLSTAVCSHVLPGKSDLNIYESLTHGGTGSRAKTKSEDVCGLFASIRVSRGEGNGWRTTEPCAGGMTRPGAETVGDRWTGQQTQTECLRSGRRQVGKSITNHGTHARATRATWNRRGVMRCWCRVCTLTVKVVVSLSEGGL